MLIAVREVRDNRCAELTGSGLWVAPASGTISRPSSIPPRGRDEK